MFKNKDQARFYLAAIIDGEGCVSQPKRKFISIGNTDACIIEACIECLDLLKIGFGISIGETDHGRTNWTINICGKNNLQAIYDLVPIQSERKLERLKQTLEGYRKDYYNFEAPFVPNEKELRELYFNKNMNIIEIAKYYKVGRGWIRSWFKTFNIELKTRSTIQKDRWKNGIYANR